ncbi:MAG: FtsX-like permease family protein, partial [Bacteroidota bacterium]
GDFPSLLVENYRERAPDVELYESMLGSLSLIYLIIIMLALVFGIINTMLMAVLERLRELGMLMAIGMNKLKVFLMIVTETLLLTLVGAPVGLALGALTVAYVGKRGLDLSAFSSTMEMYGMANVVYFDLAPEVYWQVVIVVSLTAILASIYPALKAIRLRRWRRYGNCNTDFIGFSGLYGFFCSRFARIYITSLLHDITI